MDDMEPARLVDGVISPRPSDRCNTLHCDCSVLFCSATAWNSPRGCSAPVSSTGARCKRSVPRLQDSALTPATSVPRPTGQWLREPHWTRPQLDAYSSQVYAGTAQWLGPAASALRSRLGSPQPHLSGAGTGLTPPTSAKDGAHSPHGPSLTVG